jgi:hypothetical protein
VLFATVCCLFFEWSFGRSLAGGCWVVIGLLSLCCWLVLVVIGCLFAVCWLFCRLEGCLGVPLLVSVGLVVFLFIRSCLLYLLCGFESVGGSLVVAVAFARYSVSCRFLV